MAFYKTRNTGMGNGMRILGNVQEDSGESKFRFICWNLACFLSTFAVKLLRNNGEKNNYWAILLKKTFSSLRPTTILLSLITISLT